MSIALLDVNVLVALAWAPHMHHARAHEWFKRNNKHGWATCPITQTAFVRLVSNPKIIPGAVTPAQASALLKQVVALPAHHFWEDNLSWNQLPITASRIGGHRQIVDAYLLGLCLKRKGRLVTFDRGIASLLPTDATAHECLEVLT